MDNAGNSGDILILLLPEHWTDRNGRPPSSRNNKLLTHLQKFPKSVTYIVTDSCFFTLLRIIVARMY